MTEPSTTGRRLVDGPYKVLLPLQWAAFHLGLNHDRPKVGRCPARITIFRSDDG